MELCGEKPTTEKNKKLKTGILYETYGYTMKTDINGATLIKNYRYLKDPRILFHIDYWSLKMRINCFCPWNQLSLLESGSINKSVFN